MNASDLHSLTQRYPLVIVCALHCEAKPLIDFYGLKKQASIHYFDVYQNENISLIISGLGMQASAICCAWWAGFYKIDSAWLNIGIAGHQKAAVGTLYWVNKITDTQQNRNFFPPHWFKHTMQSSSLICQHNEEKNYTSTSLYDMESAGFISSVSRFQTTELIQCLKIVSDNQASPMTRNKMFIADLIQQNIPSIHDWLTSYFNAIDQTLDRASNPKYFHQLIQDTHFTNSQKHLLKQKLHICQLHQLPLSDIQLSQFTDAKEILAELDNIIKYAELTL